MTVVGTVSLHTEDGSGVEVCDESSCQFGGTCEYDAEGSHGCVCNFNCDAIRYEYRLNFELNFKQTRQTF